MPSITPTNSRSFVDNVKLAAPPGRVGLPGNRTPVDFRSTDSQALVVGSGLIAAAEDVPVEAREDLVNCTLFAQLAATAAVANPARIVPWYNAYFETLTALGWAQTDTHLEEYHIAAKNAQAHQAILNVLAALLGPHAAALAIVKAAIDALQSMAENRPWLTLFERESKVGKSARFQVATAEVDPDGLLLAALVGFSLETESTLTQVLFFKFPSSATTLKFAAGKATICEAALKDQREAIAARLASYRAAFVGAVKLPPPPPGLVRQSGVATSARPC
jgi:hypothetical protein